MNPDRLGAVDATYLAIEDTRTPLHVASIAIFDAGPLCDDRGHVRIEDVRARVAARLGMLPRLRQRVTEVPLNAARPVWVDDEHFDIARHVDAVELPSPGDERALLRLAEDLVMRPLDRNQPLWHLRFVHGLPEGRVALIERVHHAMVDGVSGVDVSLVLLDTAPDTPDPVPEQWVPRRAPSPFELLSGAIVDRVTAPVEAVAHAAGHLTRPGDVRGGVTRTARALSELWADGLLAPRTSLNRSIGHSRRLAFVRQHLEPVHTAGAAAGAKVNDVVLAAVAGGLRELFLARGEALPSDLRLKILVPVSVRAGEESMTLGNRVGALLMPLPVGVGDAHERLAAIAATTKELKQSNEATTADDLLRFTDLLPQSVAKLIQRGIHHQPLVNMVVTNIPGPQFPLYAMGSRMLEAFPVVPLAGNMPLEVAVLSYNGQLNVCVTSDATTCPDAPAFVRGVEHSFGILTGQWEPALMS